MTRHKSITASQQGSFLEAMLLGIETETTPVELPAALPRDDTTPAATESAAPEDAASDLFGFILALSEPSLAKDFWVQSPSIGGNVEQTATLLMTVDTLQSTVPTSAIVRAFAGETDGLSNPVTSDALLHSATQTSLRITPLWLLEHFPKVVARIADTWNLLRERERLPPVNAEAARQRLAAMLVHPHGNARTLEDAENALNHCLQEMTQFAQRLYGSALQENEETLQSLVDRLMKHALREHVEEPELVRAALEAGVRKMLTGQSQRIYSAIVVSALQHPFRKAVRELLEANEFALPSQLLAHARQNGYRNVMREALKSLARGGLTAQSASVGWLKAQTKEQEHQELFWKARGGERAAVIIQGHTVVNERVIEHPEAVLIVTFNCGRAENYYPIQREDFERAKRLLWAKGYRAEEEEGYPIPENVARLWEEYFSDREYGWWYGDEAGRVIVVIRYSAARKIRNHDRLRGAAAKMQTWGYSLRYTDDALYFLPADVDMPPEIETDDRDSEEENDK